MDGDQELRETTRPTPALPHPIEATPKRENLYGRQWCVLAECSCARFSDTGRPRASCIWRRS